MEDIKEVLGEELFAQVTEKLGEKSIEFSDETKIPKYRFDEVIEAKNLYKTQNESLSTELTSFKSKFEGLDGLDKEKINEMTSQLSALQEQLAGKEKEVVNIGKNSALKEVFRGHKLKDKYFDVMKSQINLDEYELVDGKLKDIDALITSKKETFAEMFGEIKLGDTDFDKDDNKKDPKKEVTIQEKFNNSFLNS